MFSDMEKSILNGDVKEAEKLAELSLTKGVNPQESIVKGFTAGILKVGQLWEEGEYFLPELVAGAEAMKAGIGVLKRALKAEEKAISKGNIVIGTVEGDIHDIGKSLVASLLSAHGFNVIDLGMDVPVEKFVNTAQDFNADIIGMSALLTTTMTNQKRVIDLLVERGIRNRYKVIVGGAPVTPEWALKIGADDAPADAFIAVSSVKRLMEQETARR